MSSRKPAAVREAEGNPGHRPIPSEIQYPSGIICPLFLDPLAKIEWNRIITLLDGVDVLKQTDMSVLASYCQAYAMWQKAVEITNREGLTIKQIGDKGQVRMVKHPALSIAADAQKDMLRAGSKLGFNPVDRIKVPQPPKQAANSFDSLDDD